MQVPLVSRSETASQTQVSYLPYDVRPRRTISVMTAWTAVGIAVRQYCDFSKRPRATIECKVVLLQL